MLVCAFRAKPSEADITASMMNPRPAGVLHIFRTRVLTGALMYAFLVLRASGNRPVKAGRRSHRMAGRAIFYSPAVCLRSR
jgi:hypothetical protein